MPCACRGARRGAGRRSRSRKATWRTSRTRRRPEWKRRRPSRGAELLPPEGKLLPARPLLQHPEERVGIGLAVGEPNPGRAALSLEHRLAPLELHEREDDGRVLLLARDERGREVTDAE